MLFSKVNIDLKFRYERKYLDETQKVSILSTISFLVFFTKSQSNYHFPRDSKTDEHSFDLSPKFLYVLSNRNCMVLTKENCQFFASSYI